MEYLTLDDILKIRARVAPTCVNGCEVRTFHGLMSAIGAPQRAAFGAEFYPTLAEKASALVYAMIQNHPFWDGNKRIATAALRLFLERNGAVLRAGERELKAFTRQIASGQLRDGAIDTWITQRLKHET